MDILLLNKVKEISNIIKKEYDQLHGKSIKEDIKKEVFLIYEIIKKNLKALYKVRESIILSGNDSYEECSEMLKPLIRNLFKLCIYFMREQEYNIYITEQRLKEGDCDSYLKDEKFKNEYIFIDEDNYKFECDCIISQKISENVDKLIFDTQQRYIASFGNFRNKEEAVKIIEKEYTDATKYIELFLTIKETIYEKFDNYDILISALQSISYELIQLISGLSKAQKLNIELKYNLDSSLNVYFVLMDGVDSTKENTAENLINFTVALNLVIDADPELRLLCKFKTYKQDEIQGFFLGDIKKFLNIVNEIYGSRVKVVHVAGLSSEIKNIEESIFNDPFRLYGSICSKARKRMNEKDYVIAGGKFKNINSIIKISDIKSYNLNEDGFDL